MAEVGRDHDYDWAIVEPSSMRSLIQLAGRVWRHRPEKTADTANIMIMERNLRGLAGDAVAFTRPGFEQKEPAQFLLDTHNCRDLLTEQQLSRVDSVPRIARNEQLQSKANLVDLEHGVMEDLLNNPDNFIASFWREDNGNRASAHLQKISPFRYNEIRQDDYVCLPVPEDPNGYKFTFAEAAWEDLEGCTFQSKKIQFYQFTPNNKGVTPWLKTGLDEALKAVGQHMEISNQAQIARQFACVRLEQEEGKWMFDPYLGFWR